MPNPVDVLAETLPEARVIRVTTRAAGQRLILVGQAWNLDAHQLTIGDLEHRCRHRISLDTVTAVEIIGVYLKDCEV